MDKITIGLDFGTHQTKICIQSIPDEGHGEPRYEFFAFPNYEGEFQYFLPSVIQINQDNTLSYGFVNEKERMPEPELPQKENIVLEKDFEVCNMADMLYEKYATSQNDPNDIHVLSSMLQIHLQNIKERNKRLIEESELRYNALIREHQKYKNIFRYFKQATFIGGEWNNTTLISNRTLCVWYLAYIIFLLEEKYGTNFAINMGIPADEETYDVKKRLASEILASSYYLVEEVYKNDIKCFLCEKVESLLEKTKHIAFSPEIKEEYNFNIFPEAYASLVAFTSRGKLPTGMSLTADIGGGTTDISFFTIEDGAPMIYKFWSIPRGLNYVAENSGFNYAEGDFAKKANQDVIDKFNRKKHEIVCNLTKDLQRKIKAETSIPVQNLRDALKDRILVYSGGGSTYSFLTKPIDTFTDIRIVNKDIWREENVKDKAIVSKLSILLVTAYGLSISKDDANVILKNYSSLFAHLPKGVENEIQEISKDQC